MSMQKHVFLLLLKNQILSLLPLAIVIKYDTIKIIQDICSPPDIKSAGEI